MSNARDLANVGGGGVSVDSGAPDNSLVVNSSGSVGIGASSPAYKLDARLSGTSSGAVIQVGNTGSGGFGGLGVSDGGTYPLQIWGSSLAFLSGNSSYASATERMRIDSAGRVTMPYQPAVNVRKSSTHGSNGAGLTLVYWDVVDVNTGGHYSASTGLFTCPVGGVYQVTVHGINATSTNNGYFVYNQAFVHKNGAAYGGSTYGYTDGYSSLAGTWLVPCSAGDSLAIHASSFYPSINGMTIRLVG